MNYDDKTITMSNGKKYLTIEQVNYKNKIYLYLVNSEDDSDSVFVEIENDKLSQIDPILFEKEILPLFLDKLSKD